MGCCCGDDETPKKEGIVVERKCRDVLWLLLFVGFWVGMFVVCGVAFKKGDATRLVYGMDSFGMQCGKVNTWRNTTIDLTNYKKLYYLNGLELLQFSNIPYAKTVCVKECPSLARVCNSTQLPCTRNDQYICPYYRVAEQDLYGRLSNVTDVSTEYYDALATATDVKCDANFTEQAKNTSQASGSAYGFNGCDSSSTTAKGAYYKYTSQFPGKGPCYPIWVETKEYYHRCFPIYPESMTGAVVSVAAGGAQVAAKTFSTFKEYQANSNKMADYIADISKAIVIIIVAGLVAGLGLSLIWMVILRYFAGAMAWITLLAVNLCFLGITLYAYNMAGMLSSAGSVGAALAQSMPADMDPTGDTRTTWKYIAIAATVCTVIMFVLTLLMISRVKVAVACIKVASQAVGEMPSIMFFPMLPFILEVGLVIYWVSVTAVLYSAGDATVNYRKADSYTPFTFSNLQLAASGSAPALATANTTNPYANMTKADQLEACSKDSNCYISIDWDTNLKYAFIYHLFGGLWTNQFIIGLGLVVIANAVANFYWHRGDHSQMPKFPVVNAMRTTLLYHLGSIAFGSFIIAVIQLIRIIVEYINRKTQELQKNSEIARWIMCIVRCCLWCVEKILKFINRNVYIMVAAKGFGYCEAAGEAISLLVKNSLRLVTVNVVGDSLIWLGKLCVSSGAGIIAFLMANSERYTNLEKYPDTYLTSAVLPIAVSIIVAYVVGDIFFSVYEMAVDTILLCFCEDCEHNNGVAKYAPPLLMETLGEAPAKRASQAHQ